MGMQTIEDLFDHELQAAYSAERQQIALLDQMGREGIDRDIRRLYAQHRKETQAQIKRLEKVFRLRGGRPAASASPGLDGLVREKRAFLRGKPTGDLLEFYNIGAAQKVERYEITAYEALVDMAEKLGLNGAVDLLEESLREEEAALHRLKAVASEFEVADAIEEAGDEALATASGR